MKKTENPEIFPNFIDVLLNRRNEVKKILENKETEKYYESTVIQYSLMESTLKFMVFLQLSYNLAALRTYKKTSREDFNFKMDKLEAYCRGLSFYQALHLAISSNVINEKLYKQIEKIRSGRNDWIHQCWLFQYNSDFSDLERDLKILNDVFWDLTVACGDLLVDFQHKPYLVTMLTDLNYFFNKKKKKSQNE